MRRYFKTYAEAWEFVHKIATGGYDHDKQAEMCEAFRMMHEAAAHMDETENVKEDENINLFTHLLQDN